MEQAQTAGSKYKVKAPYPGSRLKIGAIIQKKLTVSGKYFIPGMFDDPEDFPHLFTKIDTTISLYDQLKEYIMGTWSKSCVKKDDGEYFAADNGKRFIYFRKGGNSFLHLRDDGDTRTVFNGIVHDIETIKLIMNLVFL